jgi:hypothetical protein
MARERQPAPITINAKPRGIIASLVAGIEELPARGEIEASWPILVGVSFVIFLNLIPCNGVKDRNHGNLGRPSQTARSELKSLLDARIDFCNYNLKQHMNPCLSFPMKRNGLKN